MKPSESRSAAHQLNPEDLRVDTYRAGGYSVRIVHLPTGLAGTSDKHASLLKAKEEALTRLRERMSRG